MNIKGKDIKGALVSVSFPKTGDYYEFLAALVYYGDNTNLIWIDIGFDDVWLASPSQHITEGVAEELEDGKIRAIATENGEVERVVIIDPDLDKLDPERRRMIDGWMESIKAKGQTLEELWEKNMPHKDDLEFIPE